MSQNEVVEENEKRKGGLASPADGSVFSGQLVKAFIEAIKHAPRRQIFFMFAVLVIAVVALALGFALVLNGQYGWAMLLFAMTVSPVLYLAVLARGVEWRPTPDSPRPGHKNVVWSRPMLATPLANDLVTFLAEEMKDLRHHAYTYLADRCADLGIKPEQVRANVFLPVHNELRDGVAYTLAMDPAFQVNMDGDPDENVTFQPSQGLTGYVYNNQEPKCAKTFENDAGRHEWEEMYKLTDEHRAQLHPGLRWIVCFPLKIVFGEATETIGILNVDGLDCEPTDDDLNLLAGALLGRVIEIAKKLESASMVRTSILYESLTEATS